MSLNGEVSRQRKGTLGDVEEVWASSAAVFGWSYETQPLQLWTNSLVWKLVCVSTPSTAAVCRRYVSNDAWSLAKAV